jgi:hypothetical protein
MHCQSHRRGGERIPKEGVRHALSYEGAMGELSPCPPVIYSRLKWRRTTPSRSPRSSSTGCLLQVSAPATVTVEAGQSAQAPMEVLQLRRSSKSRVPVQLQVAAYDAAGERLAFVNAIILPMPPHGGSGKTMLPAALGGFLIIAAVAFAFITLTGGEDNPGTSAGAGVTPPSASTVADGTTVTVPTTAPTTAPGRSVQRLPRWDFSFRVASNDCGFGAKAGDSYQKAFRFEPRAGSATLKDREAVQVSGVEPGGDILVGSFPFRADSFTYSHAVLGSADPRGSATFTTALADDGNVQSATVTERYDTPACAIVGNFTK